MNAKKLPDSIKSSEADTSLDKERNEPHMMRYFFADPLNTILCLYHFLILRNRMTDEIMEQRIEALRAFYEDFSTQTQKCYAIGSRYKSDVETPTEQDKYLMRECLSFNHTREALRGGYISTPSFYKSEYYDVMLLPFHWMRYDKEERIKNLRKFHREPETVKEGICYTLGMDPEYIAKKSHSADIENECKKIARLHKEYMKGFAYRKD